MRAIEEPSSREVRLAKFRILEAQRATEEAVGFLRNLHERVVSVQELQDFVMSFWPSCEQKTAVLSHLQKVSLFDQEVSEDDLGAIEFLSRTLVPYKLESMDSLTSIASTRMVREEDAMESWHLYASDILIANFGHGGERAFAYVVGRPGSGKTNVAMVAAEAALEKGWQVVSNVHIHGEEGEHFHYENALSGVMRRVAELRLEETPSLVIFDEGGLWWARSQAQRHESQGLGKVARVIGKLGVSTLFIEQREKGVPTTVVAFARSALYCRRPGQVRVEHRGPEVRFYRTLRDVPRTRLRYDPSDISFLVYDLDVDALFRFVGGIEEGGEAQARGVLRYLDGERQVDREAKLYAAYVMADTGELSQTSIAKQLGVSQQTVSNWLAKRAKLSGE